MSFVTQPLVAAVATKMGQLVGPVSITVFSSSQGGSITASYASSVDHDFVKLATFTLPDLTGGGVPTLTANYVASGTIACAIVHAASDDLSVDRSETGLRIALNGVSALAGFAAPWRPGLYSDVTAVTQGSAAEMYALPNILGTGEPLPGFVVGEWTKQETANSLADMIRRCTSANLVLFTDQDALDMPLNMQGFVVDSIGGVVYIHRGTNGELAFSARTTFTFTPNTVVSAKFMFRTDENDYFLGVYTDGVSGYDSGGLNMLSTDGVIIPTGTDIGVEVVAVSVLQGLMQASDFAMWLGGGAIA